MVAEKITSQLKQKQVGLNPIIIIIIFFRHQFNLVQHQSSLNQLTINHKTHPLSYYLKSKVQQILRHQHKSEP
jgi:hypothetical protein